jgi:hypothetical protein
MEMMRLEYDRETKMQMAAMADQMASASQVLAELVAARTV